ncbi:MAG: hypothetical protein HKN04_06365 [Rhodothermaceae bacterium]|nr:hypothetical protein [Rhodothermaceae bacterium]
MRLSLVCLLALLVSGCVPYAVGTTPEPAPPGEIVASTTVQVAAGQPNLRKEVGDNADERVTTFTFDNGVQFGLDEHSEAGARLVGSSGIVATYKRKLTPSGPRRIATAVLVGGGFVGLGSHAHVEATLLGAYPLSPTMTPYGGVRVQHLLPLSNDALSPNPAFGGFVGVRLGEPDLGISPELGIFYSSTDTLFETDWVIVPSVTVHGSRLLQALGIGF